MAADSTALPSLGALLEAIVLISFHCVSISSITADRTALPSSGTELELDFGIAAFFEVTLEDFDESRLPGPATVYATSREFSEVGLAVVVLVSSLSKLPLDLSKLSLEPP